MRKFGLIGYWIRSLAVGPAGLTAVCLAVYLPAVWFFRKRRGKCVRWEVGWGVGWAAVFLCICLPYPSVLLDLPLEAWGRAIERRLPVPPDLPPEIARSTVVFVLGAGVTDSGFLSSESLDRLEHAFTLWKQIPDAWFLFAEGGIGRYRTEARVRAFLERMGLPPDRILLETASLTTQQNIRLSLPILRQHHIQHVILVTTRRHLPRGVAVCRRYGIEPMAVSGWYTPPSLMFCPSWRDLSRFSAVINEYIGYIGYRILGWA